MNSPVFSLSDFCQALVLPTEKTLTSWFWTFISILWSWYGLLIFSALILWLAWEIKTRYGTSHYNSENGFSPTFNRVVGGGTYFLLQAVLYLIFKLALGGGAYCLPLPYTLHIVIFILTGKLLNLIGFWPRLEKPNNRKGWKRNFRI